MASCFCVKFCALLFHAACVQFVMLGKDNVLAFSSNGAIKASECHGSHPSQEKAMPNRYLTADDVA